MLIIYSKKYRQQNTYKLGIWYINIAPTSTNMKWNNTISSKPLKNINKIPLSLSYDKNKGRLTI